MEWLIQGEMCSCIVAGECGKMRGVRIAVLMTCYNRVETTLRCLRNLFSQRVDAEIEVWLVDDGSTDGTGARVRDEFPRVNVIKGDGKLYWCKGMRLAWETALGGEYTKAGIDAWLWLNDDVELEEGALGRMVKDAEATGWEGAIIGSFVDRNGMMTYGVLENWRWIEPIGKPRLTNGDISGNCVLIPRKAFEKVGIIASDYSHAYGDYDYSARMRKVGVPYYLTSTTCGRCNNDNLDPALTSKSLWTRLSYLFKPGAHNLRDALAYRLRYYGIFRAILSGSHVIYLVIKGK